MIPVEKAQQIVLECMSCLETEQVPLADATGRILAEDVESENDTPPVDVASADGYAVSTQALSGADGSQPALLDLVADVRAGHVWDQPIRKNQAVKLTAGVGLPEGADAVVSLEHGVRESPRRVRIYKQPRRGENVRFRGQDLAAGTVVLTAGRTLSPADIGSLAALGKTELLCYRRPRVSILATGDELSAPDEQLVPGKSPSSNTFTVLSKLQELGAVPQDIGVAKAVKTAVKEKIEAGLESDLLINLSGPSSAYFELTREALNEMGIELKFWKLAIRPGKPVIFGLLKGKPVFSLPGNPVSTLVTFEQFVRPAVMKMAGRSGTRRLEVKARLTEDVKAGGGLRHFILSHVELEEGLFTATPINLSKGGIFASLTRTNGLIVIPPEIPYAKAGSFAWVQVIGDVAS